MKTSIYRKNINWNTKGRADISPILENPIIFTNLISDLLKKFKREDYSKILALDALGFIIGAPMAVKARKPLILVRKEGKLPQKDQDKLSVSFIDYTKQEKTFEIKKDSIKKRDKILIVDEWIETGAQVKATIKIIESLGAKVAGITAINADRNENTKILFEKYNLKPILSGDLR